MRPSLRVIVMDTSTVIDLLDAGLLALVLRLPKTRFVIPREVRSEVSKAPYHRQLDEAITAGWLEVLRIDDLREIALKADLAKRFGQGEASCMAIAIHREWYWACEERGRAFRREVHRRQLVPRLVRVEHLRGEVVKSGLLPKEKVEGALHEAESRWSQQGHQAKAEHLRRMRQRFIGEDH